MHVKAQGPNTRRNSPESPTSGYPFVTSGTSAAKPLPLTYAVRRVLGLTALESRRNSAGAQTQAHILLHEVWHSTREP